MIKPWSHIGSRPLGNFRIFTLREDRRLSPRTGQELDFIVLDCVDWVNVVAITPQQELVMVEQFRHGTNTLELELPGGMMDVGETPLASGLRELHEETGYEGDADRAQVIGNIFPNPAIQTNTAHTILVENCTLRRGVKFDDGEDLVTRLVPLAEVPNLVRDGRIRHAIVVVALYHFDLWQRQNRPQ